MQQAARRTDRVAHGQTEQHVAALTDTVPGQQIAGVVLLQGGEGGQDDGEGGQPGDQILRIEHARDEAEIGDAGQGQQLDQQQAQAKQAHARRDCGQEAGPCAGRLGIGRGLP